jgi:TolA-binding protein
MIFPCLKSNSLCMVMAIAGCACLAQAGTHLPSEPDVSHAPLPVIDPDQVAVEPAAPAPTPVADSKDIALAPAHDEARAADNHTTTAPATPGLPTKDSGAAPSQLAGLQKLGLSLTERGDWAAAEIAFRQILTARSAGPSELTSALIGLARVYRRQGALTKAAAIYERFLKDYPGDGQVPDALLELGRTHRALGASQLAIARFYSVINSTIKLPAEGFAHYQMLAKTAQFEIAETHLLTGNFTEASKFYTRLRLLDLAPADRARAHFKSAYALHLDKDYEGAVTTLHTYLEQWPGDEHGPEARYLLSLTLRTLGRQQEALEATLQLLRTQQAGGDPKAWAYWQRRTGNQLANDFFQSGDTANALAVYQGLAALGADPNWRLPINYQIALCHERLRQTDLAVAAYQSIVDGAKPGPATAPANPELAELARMAAWRLNQLQWTDHTDRQLTAIFSSGVAAIPKKPATTPSQSPATPAPAHDYDQTRSTPPTPSNL